MKKLVFLICFLATIISTVNAQSCLPSKPALSEFKNHPANYIQGADTDGIRLIEQGYIWLDKAASKGYNNAFELLHANGIDWVRIMLYWNDTVGENNLLYATNVIRDANINGLNVAVIMFLSDGQADLGNQQGPSCINLNNITLPTYYTGSGCQSFKDLTISQKENIIKEYSKNVVNYFQSQGAIVKLYEIGNEVDCGIAGIFHLTDNIDYLKQYIWPNETRIIKAAISGIKTSDLNALVQTHIAVWNNVDWAYSFFKFIKDNGVNLDYAAFSYYPTEINDTILDKFSASVLQNIGWLLKTTDNVSQELGVPIIISEYAYPSDTINPSDFSSLLFPVHGLQTIPAWLSATCPKCRITPDYPFTPQGQKNWVHDFHQTVYNEPNIAGSFYLCPECADEYWVNFSALFYRPEQNTCENSWCEGNIKKSCSSSCQYSEITCSSNIVGDINGDCEVNILDAITLSLSCCSVRPDDSSWNPNADLNSDGVVNILDAILLGNHFLKKCL